MKKTFILCLGGFLFFLNLFSKQKPNIILFLVDEAGLMDTSVPMLADKEGRPKNSLRLVSYPQYGTAGQAGYAFLSSTPSPYAHPRVSPMTGQNSARPRYSIHQPGKQKCRSKGLKWEGLNSRTSPFLHSSHKWLSYHFCREGPFRADWP